MLLGQSSPLRGDLVGGEMPAPDEVTAVVGGCTNWLRDEANGRYSRLSSACRSEPTSFQVVYASLRRAQPAASSRATIPAGGRGDSQSPMGARDSAPCDDLCRRDSLGQPHRSIRRGRSGEPMLGRERGRRSVDVLGFSEGFRRNCLSTAFFTPMEIAATWSNQQRAQSRKLFRYSYCSSLLANCGIHNKCPANKAGQLSKASVKSLTYPAGYLA